VVLQRGSGMIKALVVGGTEAPHVVGVLQSASGMVQAADLGLTEGVAVVGHVVLVLLRLH